MLITGRRNPEFHVPDYESEKGQEAFKVYEKERDMYNEKYQIMMKAHKKTESQEKNWVEWPDYIKMVSKMRDTTKGMTSTKEWTMADKMRFQDYLVALLYCSKIWTE